VNGKLKESLEINESLGKGESISRVNAFTFLKGESSFEGLLQPSIHPFLTGE
jgi:hypothetical protein